MNLCNVEIAKLVIMSGNMRNGFPLDKVLYLMLLMKCIFTILAVTVTVQQ